MIMSARQCRAARALLGWEQWRLAVVSGITRRTIAHLELETVVPTVATLLRLREVLEAEGVQFSSDEDGEGVRLAKRGEERSAAAS